MLSGRVRLAKNINLRRKIAMKRKNMLTRDGTIANVITANLFRAAAGAGLQIGGVTKRS